MSVGPDDLLAPIIGYLNFSDGTPSPKFQASLNEYFRRTPVAGGVGPAEQLAQTLRAACAPETAAYGDTTQAKVIVEAVFDDVLPAYEHHHRDLLQHLSTTLLRGPFFLARVVEATLSEMVPIAEGAPIDRAANATSILMRLSDYLGHRPVAVLETAQKIEPYPHERVRPIPIYLQGAGVCMGPYESLIESTLAILGNAERSLLVDCDFSLESLEEIALDPRAYDHGHPVNQRPGYQFGEWDPHHIDRKGQYSRFVLRPMILDALLAWIDQAKAIPPHEAIFEASAALAGTMLLAAGISGRGPEAHDSETTLGVLIPRVARCRDRFYSELLAKLKGDQGKRLAAEAKALHQPFGGIRQFLNQYLARQRSEQLQSDHLAQLFARMGFAESARRQAQRIPAASIRMRCEIQVLLTTSTLLIEQGKLEEAIKAVTDAEDLLHRAIECGAMVDPWNILGFQGNFSIFPALENSVTDPRVDLLVKLMQLLFDHYAQLLRELAARGTDQKMVEGVSQRFHELATWWDKFATVEVSDVRHVSGSESEASAKFVAEVLAEWRSSGEASGDVAFWKQHAHRFESPQSFALVLEPLLQRGDLVASMALLMLWLGNSEMIPLQDDAVSFFDYALQWVLAFSTSNRGKQIDLSKGGLLVRFFAHLEANAEEYWNVPSLEMDGTLPTHEEGTFDQASAELTASEEEDEDEPEDLFSAAYEGVTFRDSAADGIEGEIVEGPGGFGDDPLSAEADRLEERLDFLDMLAQLWQLSGAVVGPQAPAELEPLKHWCLQAQSNRKGLGKLMDRLHAVSVRPPGGSQDAIIEYDRQQTLRDSLLFDTIMTTTEMSHAMTAMMRVSGELIPTDQLADWEPLAIEIQRQLWLGDAKEVCKLLPQLLDRLESVPLLYVPLDQGGDPQAIYEAKYARDILRKLAGDLPRLGLYRETHQLLQSALSMEKSQAAGVHQISEFNTLFSVGYQSVVESLLREFSNWYPGEDQDERAAALVVDFVGRFSATWMEHVSGVRLSELESVGEPKEWNEVVAFIKKYGRELFTQKFMTFSNLRGILHQGVGAFLDALIEEQDPYHPMQLVTDLEAKTLSRGKAIRWLDFIMRAVLENYDIYRDYNTVTTQSDYGDNIYMLLEMLRLLAEYDRQRWSLQPAYMAHNLLARRGRPRAAELLQQVFAEETRSLADASLKSLAAIEKKFGLRLPSIADRLGERFVQPLHLDRILALVRPAMREARGQTLHWMSAEDTAKSAVGVVASEPTDPSESAETKTFALFEQELEDYIERRQGGGPDVPAWIRQLEQEVHQVSGTQIHQDLEELLRVPAISISITDFQQQLERWEDPLD